MRIKEHQHTIQLTTLPRLFPINCYLVIEEDTLTLVDASVSRVSDRLIQTIKKFKKPLRNIVLTHLHSDHIGDINNLKTTFPEATISMSEMQYKNSDIDASIEVKIIKPGDNVGSLKMIETPGHTLDSVSYLDLRTQNVFVGDLVQTRGGISICGDKRFLFPFPSFATIDPLKSITSFNALQKYNPNILYCGHGDSVDYKHPELKQSITRLHAKSNR